MWVDKLAKTIALGYTGGRGCKPLKVRSGVYRGVLAAMFAHVARGVEGSANTEMFEVGRDEAEAAFRGKAVEHKLMPLP